MYYCVDIWTGLAWDLRGFILCYGYDCGGLVVLDRFSSSMYSLLYSLDSSSISKQ